MIPFLRMKKSLVIFSLLFLGIIPIFGFNFLISLIRNVFLLIFLVPLLICLIAFLYLNSLKSKVKTCNECGTISLANNTTCLNCGADLNDLNQGNFENLKKPSQATIEVKAEEVN